VTPERLSGLDASGGVGAGAAVRDVGERETDMEDSDMSNAAIA
jgi:hypothetical protein